MPDTGLRGKLSEQGAAAVGDCLSLVTVHEKENLTSPLGSPPLDQVCKWFEREV